MKNNIASERVKLGLSHEQFGKRLRVSRDTVRNWESGEAPIKASLLVEIADLCGCSIDYLMGRSEERLVRGALLPHSLPRS